MDIGTSPEIAWALICNALVMLTLPGVALFYGGMVRKKNVVNTMGLPLLSTAAVPLLWLGWARAATAVEGASAGLSTGLSGALALALVMGALVERVRVSFFLVFGGIWVALVFAPVTQWLWGGGWLARLGCLDFAGGAVIHISAGVTALASAILVGPRRGYGRTEMAPHALPLAMGGAAFMWMGWVGFTSGRGVATITVAAGALVAIQAAAAAAALAWTLAEWIQRDKPTALGTVSGAVAGLVAIAPAAGYVSPLSALVIGVGAGGFCYMVVNYVKPILGYDDSLDVFGMHGVGGTWGMIATGLFATTAVNPDGSDGLFYGYPYQFGAQALAALVVWAYSGVMTVLLFKGLQLVLPARVEAEAEVTGLDLSQHGEKGYS